MKKIVIITSPLQDNKALQQQIQKKFKRNATFFEVENWNEELSPWEFGQFKGNAIQILEKLKNTYDLSNTILVGYSLAGLFCLWASFQCEIAGIGCCSSSLWYPGFIDYMDKLCLAKAVYLSLGKKEKKARHPLVRSIEMYTNVAYEKLCEQNIPCILEMNDGNHFYEVDKRHLKAIQWLLER